jgi:hypothetical protein
MEITVEAQSAPTSVNAVASVALSSLPGGVASWV